jgi:murein DD-endopeptidase MepM/ murein hydrolase activator NlpD
MRRSRALFALAALVLLAVAGQAAAYTVKKGETLSGIAARLKLDVPGLVKANKLASPDRIYAGQTLTLPGARTTPTTLAMKTIAATKPAPAPAPAPLPPLPSPVVVIKPSGQSHVVKSGETLSGIAAALHTTVDALARANGIAKPNLLRVGATLTIGAPPWVCPVQGKRDFIDSWGFPRPGGLRHLGVDIMAARGAPVVSPWAGTLELRTGKIGGNAFYVHGDDGFTYYGAHLDTVTARAGRIDRGAQIGTVGDTGDARGGPTHLHFEIHPGGGDAVNPYFTTKQWC